MQEGISVGYGDNYKPFLEGQSLSLDGLKSGDVAVVPAPRGERRLTVGSVR